MFDSPASLSLGLTAAAFVLGSSAAALGEHVPFTAGRFHTDIRAGRGFVVAQFDSPGASATCAAIAQARSSRVAS